METFMHHWLSLNRDWYDTPAELFVGDASTYVAALTETSVYDLIEDAIIAYDAQRSPVYLVAFGWAAPVDSGRPSHHPERRRVALFIEIGDDTRIATMFIDDIANPDFTQGATGDLVDAINGARRSFV